MNNPPPSSVLILEDEAMLSLMLEDVVRGMGARVVHAFAAAADALQALADGHYDFAILDVLVRDGTSAAVADALATREIPFIFSTAVDPEALEPRHRDRTVLIKPYEEDVLHASIIDLFPPGLR